MTTGSSTPKPALYESTGMFDAYLNIPEKNTAHPASLNPGNTPAGSEIHPASLTAQTVTGSGTATQVPGTGTLKGYYGNFYSVTKAIVNSEFGILDFIKIPVALVRDIFALIGYTVSNWAAKYDSDTFKPSTFWGMTAETPKTIAVVEPIADIDPEELKAIQEGVDAFQPVKPVNREAVTNAKTAIRTIHQMAGNPAPAYTVAFKGVEKVSPKENLKEFVRLGKQAVNSSFAERLPIIEKALRTNVAVLVRDFKIQAEEANMGSNRAMLATNGRDQQANNIGAQLVRLAKDASSPVEMLSLLKIVRSALKNEAGLEPYVENKAAVVRKNSQLLRDVAYNDIVGSDSFKGFKKVFVDSVDAKLSEDLGASNANPIKAVSALIDSMEKGQKEGLITENDTAKLLAVIKKDAFSEFVDSAARHLLAVADGALVIDQNERVDAEDIADDLIDLKVLDVEQKGAFIQAVDGQVQKQKDLRTWTANLRKGEAAIAAAQKAKAEAAAAAEQKAKVDATNAANQLKADTSLFGEKQKIIQRQLSLMQQVSAEKLTPEQEALLGVELDSSSESLLAQYREKINKRLLTLAEFNAKRTAIHTVGEWTGTVYQLREKYDGAIAATHKINDGTSLESRIQQIQSKYAEIIDLDFELSALRTRNSEQSSDILKVQKKIMDALVAIDNDWSDSEAVMKKPIANKKLSETANALIDLRNQMRQVVGDLYNTAKTNKEAAVAAADAGKVPQINASGGVSFIGTIRSFFTRGSKPSATAVITTASPAVVTPSVPSTDEENSKSGMIPLGLDEKKETPSQGNKITIVRDEEETPAIEVNRPEAPNKGFLSRFGF